MSECSIASLAGAAWRGSSRNATAPGRSANCQLQGQHLATEFRFQKLFGAVLGRQGEGELEKIESLDVKISLELSQANATCGKGAR